VSLAGIVFAFAPAVIGATERVPGPATGGSTLRYVVLSAELSPSELGRGQVGTLAVSMVPREGFAWRDARLAPPSVTVTVPADWRATPENPALSPIGAPKGRRGFTVDVMRGRAEGKVALSLRFACVSTSGDEFGKLFIEEADVELDVPSGGSDREAIAVTEHTGPAAPSDEERDTRPPGDEAGSPLMPALFFAGATVLLLAGIAVSMRKARMGDE